MRQLIWAFWNAKQYRLRAGWRVLLHFIATLFGFILAIVAVGLVFQPDGPPGPEFMAIGAVIQNTIIITVVVLACILLDRRKFRDLGLHLNGRFWLDLLGGLALGAVLIALIFLIEYQQGLISLGDANLDWNRLLTLQFGWIVAMIFVGTGEEIMSRGYHLKNLTEGFQRLGFVTSFLLAAVIGSSVFGLLHAMNPNATVIATMGVLAAGLMFCVARICTGSLAAPIGMHISWNYCQGAVFGFPVSGQPMEGSLITIDSTVDSIWTGGEFGPEAGLLGLIAIAIASTVFALWPKKESNWKENLVELVRFRRRVPIRSSRIAAKDKKPEQGSGS